MKEFWRFSGLLSLWIMAVVSCVLLFIVLQWAGVIVLLVLVILYSWIIYAYLYYRHCRREELLHLLAGSADDALPLAPALHAYLLDRPVGPMRRFWLACLLCVLPVPGFYWLWYRQNNFDRRIGELAQLLEHRVSLHEGLNRLPALATHETILAAAIGESTGQLPRCLRGSARSHMGALWINFVPHLIYPLVVLLVIAMILSFIGYFIIPKFKKIFGDFGVDLPDVTRALLQQADVIVDHRYAIILGIQGVFLAIVILVFSSTARWFFP